MNVAPPTPPSIPVASRAPSLLAPVTETSRLIAVDVLRGVAVLGILGMNILSFALPMDAYVDPVNAALTRYAGEFRGANYIAWLVSHVLLDLKMMSIFSMLFGAGLVLMGDRAESTARRSFASIYYRRLLWLFVIGMVHAYAIWYGDILVTYALCGLVLYPLRRLRPRALIPLGVGVMLVTVVIVLLLGGLMGYVRHQAQRGDAEMARQWAEISTELVPQPAVVDAEVAAMRGSLVDVLRANARNALEMQLMITPMMLLWRALGLMLVGMGLMKLGVFGAQCSNRFYAWMLVLGYGTGIPIVTWGAFDQIAHGFDMIHALRVGWHYNYLGSVPVALGHVALVMLIVKSGAIPWLTQRLAAVGRMALTNYLAQSVICTFIFFGWGLGLFGTIERAWLWPFVIGVWILELAWSPWWLARFRFGPVEWLWRSLSYGKRQPFSRAALSTGTS